MTAFPRRHCRIFSSASTSTTTKQVFPPHNHGRRKSNLALSLGSSPSPFYTASLLLVSFIRPWQTHLCKFRAPNTSLTKRPALHNVISRCLLSRATTIWNSTLNCFCPLLSPPRLQLQVQGIREYKLAMSSLLVNNDGPHRHELPNFEIRNDEQRR